MCTVAHGYPEDPIIRKLREAAESRKNEAEVAAGERLLAGDFKKVARALGPGQRSKLLIHLKERCASYNVERPSGLPELRFVSSGRVDAGKYSIGVDSVEGLEDFRLRIAVGLRPNAGQFMDEVPDIAPDVNILRGEVDEEGFFWRNLADGEKKQNDQIVDEALEELSRLLAEDA